MGQKVACPKCQKQVRIRTSRRSGTGETSDISAGSTDAVRPQEHEHESEPATATAPVTSELGDAAAAPLPPLAGPVGEVLDSSGSLFDPEVAAAASEQATARARERGRSSHRKSRSHGQSGAAEGLKGATKERSRHKSGRDGHSHPKTDSKRERSSRDRSKTLTSESPTTEPKSDSGANKPLLGPDAVESDATITRKPFTAPTAPAAEPEIKRGPGFSQGLAIGAALGAMIGAGGYHVLAPALRPASVAPAAPPVAAPPPAVAQSPAAPPAKTQQTSKPADTAKAPKQSQKKQVAALAEAPTSENQGVPGVTVLSSFAKKRYFLFFFENGTNLMLKVKNDTAKPLSSLKVHAAIQAGGFESSPLAEADVTVPFETPLAPGEERELQVLAPEGPLADSQTPTGSRLTAVPTAFE